MLMLSKLLTEQERVFCAADGNFCSPGTRGFARPSAVSALFAGSSATLTLTLKTKKP